MIFYCVETEERGLSVFNWFETRAKAEAFTDDPTKVIEVENPECEEQVGGNHYVPPSSCGSTAVILRDGVPLCALHAETPEYFEG